MARIDSDIRRQLPSGAVRQDADSGTQAGILTPSSPSGARSAKTRCWPARLCACDRVARGPAAGCSPCAGFKDTDDAAYEHVMRTARPITSPTMRPAVPMAIPITAVATSQSPTATNTRRWVSVWGLAPTVRLARRRTDAAAGRTICGRHDRRPVQPDYGTALDYSTTTRRWADAVT